VRSGETGESGRSEKKDPPLLAERSREEEEEVEMTISCVALFAQEARGNKVGLLLLRLGPRTIPGPCNGRG